jgi:uncharacterized membrane protein
MENRIRAGRSVFAIGMMALGAQQIVNASFLPVFLPAWPPDMPGDAIGAYILGLALIAAGLAILSCTMARGASLVMGSVILLICVLVDIPYQLNHYPAHLGSWTNCLKELGISGCFFIVAGTFPRVASLSGGSPSRLNAWAEWFIPVGRYFFALMMLLFGIDHFLYLDFVASLVPTWIPGPYFWSYFAGVALFGAGLAIILDFRVRLVANLLAIMIFLWLVLLHIPRAIADPHSLNGNEITSVFEAFAYPGIALVLAAHLPVHFSRPGSRQPATV